MQLLPNIHISPETAYVVDDYPYGFHLRCKIRYWLDCNLKKGARLVSQTTNPKVPGERWNKPKASTYSSVAGAMCLDDKGHVTWVGLSEYSGSKESIAFRHTYGPAVPEILKPKLHAWIAAKLVVEERTEAGDDLRTAGIAGTIAFAKALKQGGA